jgi:hypothetical protein
MDVEGAGTLSDHRDCVRGQLGRGDRQSWMVAGPSRAVQAGLDQHIPSLPGRASPAARAGRRRPSCELRSQKRGTGGRVPGATESAPDVYRLLTRGVDGRHNELKERAHPLTLIESAQA